MSEKVETGRSDRLARGKGMRLGCLYFRWARAGTTVKAGTACVYHSEISRDKFVGGFQ